MKTAKEVIEEINAKKICTPHWLAEELDMPDLKEIAALNMDERRWYTIGTLVYRIGDSFIGVRGPISLKSESMDYSDTGAVCEAFEMEAVPSVTYKRKA